MLKDGKDNGALEVIREGLRYVTGDKFSVISTL